MLLRTSASPLANAERCRLIEVGSGDLLRGWVIRQIEEMVAFGTYPNDGRHQLNEIKKLETVRLADKDSTWLDISQL